MFTAFCSIKFVFTIVNNRDFILIIVDFKKIYSLLAKKILFGFYLNMRINYFQPTYNINSSNQPNKQNCFAIQSGNVSFQGKFFNPLAELNNYTAKEYQNLFFCEKIKLRNRFGKMIENPAKREKINDTILLHEQAAGEAKKALDERFGEGNYVVITLGRSVSSIGKVLGYLIGDESVKQVPMSRRCLFNMHQGSVSRASKEDINFFREYLESIGLTKEAIEKSDKKFIITDYCCTGRSLNAATQFLKIDQLLGNSENIVPVSFLDLIQDEGLNLRLEPILFWHGLKDHSFVSSIRELSSVKEMANNPDARQSLEDKLTWFTLIDRQMRHKAN